jgi:hypothetical protein
MEMTSRKASECSSILIMPLGSHLCASAPRAAGAGAVRQVGQLASQAHADTRAQRATSTPEMSFANPRSREAGGHTCSGMS